MQVFKFIVIMKVADSWIADGFQVKDRIDQIEEKIAELLPYAYGHEVKVSVSLITHPSENIINSLQNGTLEAKD
jgi:hypothetical protein